jgi:SAM-dependent methyltransferase
MGGAVSMADDLPRDDLAELSRSTLADYTRRAESFREQTRDHDVSQNIQALLSAIRGTPPFDILDLGCGPGRDLKSFAALGHRPVGLEGCAEFAAMAEADGLEVWRQDFLAMDLPPNRFDGLFANATLFHIPSRELPRVLKQFHATLRPGGILFSSNPRGHNEEGWFNGRYCAYHDFARWQGFLTDAGFEEIEHYYRPMGLPREQQPWLASVWRKV